MAGRIGAAFLDELHDRTAEIMFEGRASVQEDVQRHRAWSESLKGAQMSPEEVLI